LALLEVRDLSLHYRTKKGEVSAVENVSFSLEQGESLGLVGESGCGKTSLALTLLRLMPENGYIRKGQIVFKGVDLVKLPEEMMRKVRWGGISMVFQAAMNSLNPVYKVGDQIIEAIQAHEPLSNAEAHKRVAELFDLVGLNPQRMDHYPHEYSGGMRQRAVIAMALACHPDLIIADEPTTALDVIVQDRILRRMDALRRQLNMSMIYISHDIAVIAEVADQIGVMYAGKLVEFGTTEDIFKRPKHPYTAALMSSFPSIKGEKVPLATVPGEPPNLLKPPPGCRFNPRCPYATAVCSQNEPLLEAQGDAHLVACWHPVLGKVQVKVG
jgi:peptide/nickel transport system ATP-binding protein